LVVAAGICNLFRNRMRLAYVSAMDAHETSTALRLTLLRRLMETGAARAMREAAGLSYSEAAAGAKIDRITIFRWETHRRRPHGDAALRYLSLLEELTAR